MIHGMRDLGEEGPDVLLRERLGQRATSAQEMTGFHGVAREAVVLHHEVLKKMFEGIEPPINRRWGEVRLALLPDKARNIPPGHRTGRFVEGRKKQPEIAAIIVDGMWGIVPHTQGRTELCHRVVSHRYLPLTACCWAIFAIAVSSWCFFVVS